MALRNKILLLAALASFGTASVFSPALAQVKAPHVKATTKAKPKPVAKADPSDTSSDQLNARWQQENGVYAGFTQAAPMSVAAMVPASYATAAVANDWGDRLVTHAMKYLGTPYRYGGTSPKTGFDCSGFVYFLYDSVFGQRIPRMPHEMAREGQIIARSDLQRGDLVLFGSRGRYTHVGIYAGNDQFVHATRRGSPVMVTHMESNYFEHRFMTAVRLPPH